MFIKRGEGKILSVIEDDADLEKQKKAFKNASTVATPSKEVSETKKAESN